MDNSEDVWDVSNIPLFGHFDSQVQCIMQSVRLSVDELKPLNILLTDLKQSLNQIWSGCEIFPFGSLVTGLAIKSSDVDCYVCVPQHIRQNQKAMVIRACRMLRCSRLFYNVIAITTAKVPIVKFTHYATNTPCDINFKSLSGVCNSKLIRDLLHMDRRALLLAILVKYWSKVHNLTGTNLMPSYALTLMVIFYLQQQWILPTVRWLQNDVCEYVDMWNVAVNERVYISKNMATLYELFGGFFKFYSQFKYEDNIISPYLGEPIKRDIFKNTNKGLPEFELYRYNVNVNGCKPLRLDTKVCIQDPFEHDRNCSLAVHPKLAAKMLFFLQHSSDIYNRCGETSFLRAVLLKQDIETVIRQPDNPLEQNVTAKHNVAVNNKANRPKHIFQNKIHKNKHKKAQRNNFIFHYNELRKQAKNRR